MKRVFNTYRSFFYMIAILLIPAVCISAGGWLYIAGLCFLWIASFYFVGLTIFMMVAGLTTQTELTKVERAPSAKCPVIK